MVKLSVYGTLFSYCCKFYAARFSVLLHVKPLFSVLINQVWKLIKV